LYIKPAGKWAALITIRTVGIAKLILLYTTQWRGRFLWPICSSWYLIFTPCELVTWCCPSIPRVFCLREEIDPVPRKESKFDVSIWSK
jgi:hypothetical protein